MNKDKPCQYMKVKYYRLQRYYVFCAIHQNPVAICHDERTAKSAAKDFNDEQADCRRDFL